MLEETKQSATMGELQALHKMVAKSLKNRIEQDIDDNIPTDAATLGAAIKFLKDNSVTADPANSDDLNELRDKLKEQAATRRKRTANVVSLVNADIATGT